MKRIPASRYADAGRQVYTSPESNFEFIGLAPVGLFLVEVEVWWFARGHR